jgi:hypothetical protein
LLFSGDILVCFSISDWRKGRIQNAAVVVAILPPHFSEDILGKLGMEILKTCCDLS